LFDLSIPHEDLGTIPHMKFEEYSEKLKHCLMMKRKDGILEARLHTNGDSMQWGAPAHQGLHYFFDWAGRDPDNEVIILAVQARTSSKAWVSLRPARAPSPRNSAPPSPRPGNRFYRVHAVQRFWV
jgi:hypothetical protein